MRSKSPEKKDAIIAFINEYFDENKRMPSVKEVSTGINLAKTSTLYYLREMNDKGMLEYNSRIISTPQTKILTSGYTIAPIAGSIPCGALESETQSIEAYIPLSSYVFGKGELFILKASGDSMEDVGIYDGDLVVIELTSSARVGDIVVALDENNTSTLKKYMGTRNGKAVLAYMNEQVYPGKEILVDELIVQGVARKVIKDL